MIITTGKSPNMQMIKEACELAERWGMPYQPRGKRSFFKWLAESNEAIYVVGKTANKLYHPKSSQAFFFHPSMAWIRARRIRSGFTDPFVQAMNLKRGMNVCDATLGLGADAIVASYVAGKEGSVTGIEKNPYTASIVHKGLKTWSEADETFNQAMRRIHVRASDSLDFLKRQPDESYDVVYFDPMFEKPGDASVHLNALRSHAFYEPIDENYVREALRTAKERIVIKSSYPHSYYEELGFTFINRRSSASFRYGVKEKRGNRDV